MTTALQRSTLEWTDASDKNADDSRAMSLVLSTTL